MKFGEKLLAARKQLGISRDALSEMTGISKRAIAYYELEGKLPKQRSSVEALAAALRTTPETLTDDNAEFVLQAGEAFGAQGQKEAQKIVKQIRSLYAGGTLNEKDIDAMMLAIQDAYWIAKKKLLAKDRPEAEQ
ncbi:MAG: helix-turn-helix transcriptional regulator [Clostridia bacterium]|nr:helix-turn-helix transcriptional regulator [Clostridia bacterium]